MELEEKGILEKYNVRLIGTTAETIFKAEDRQAFKDTMEKIGEPCAASQVVHNVQDGIKFPIPLVIRSYFVRHIRLAEAAVVSHITRPSWLRS